MRRLLRNFVAKIFGIKQCQCPPEEEVTILTRGWITVTSTTIINTVAQIVIKQLEINEAVKEYAQFLVASGQVSSLE